MGVDEPLGFKAGVSSGREPGATSTSVAAVAGTTTMPSPGVDDAAPTLEASDGAPCGATIDSFRRSNDHHAPSERITAPITAPKRTRDRRENEAPEPVE